MRIIAKRLDLTGNVYGDFTVIEMLYGYKYVNNKPRTYCRCIGIDNNEYIIRADALQSGATKHLKNVGNKIIAQDITNNKYGLLTALYPTDKKAANGSIIWHCRCECGNYVDVPVGNLNRGHTLSCGCNKKSKWEILISDYLSQLNIEFEEQKTFQNCRNSNGRNMLPFDFYLPKYNKIIEYDGEHHFNEIKGWGGREKFLKTLENDNIKNQFCENNNIELLRIPYVFTEQEVINSITQFIMPVTITA